MPLVRIRRQLLRHGGQGVPLADLKTAGSRRTTAPFAARGRPLAAHRTRQAQEERTRRIWRNSAHLVFTSTIGTPLDPEAFGRTVPRICKRAGLGHWSIHGLRHSCASPLLAMGVPVEVVSDTLGHASIRVTMHVDGHLLAPARVHAVEAMSRALWHDELPNIEPLATRLATDSSSELEDNAPTRNSVG